MAGRRLLDLALLFNASKNIAKQHLKLRSQQLDTYNKTSSLAKAVKDQTDRVTLTAQAAAALARRFNEAAPTQATNSQSSQATQDVSIPRSETVDRNLDGTVNQEQGLNQDHHYERDEINATSERPPQHDLNVQQERAAKHPTPDRSTAPHGAPIDTATLNDDIFSERSKHRSGSEPLATKRSGLAKGIQPAASKESTIPDARSQTQRGHQRVQYPKGERNIPGLATGRPDASSKFSTGGDDVFSQRAQGSERKSYSPPGTKIPERGQSGPQAQGQTITGDMNPDVFYSTTSAESQTVSEETPDDVDINVFRSSKVSRMLSQKPKLTDDKPPKGPETVDAAADDIHSLAADISKESSASAEGQSAESAQPMRESAVPSSRFGRLWEYGGLATSMAFGAVGETFRRATGTNTPGGSLMLSAGNMERLVAKLSRMRGAALKLGQMMSFQDSKMLPAPIHEVLLRVQDHADYMPAWQRNKVLSDNLGSDWQSLFSTFDEVPIAAASIGQVHRAKMAADGTEVAVKVQYPGVANSISSDLSNLSILLTASRLLPKGLYLDKTIANARTELAWECDYIREAECQTRFKDLIKDESDIFTVPAVIPSASGKQVLTAELMHGTAVTKPSLNLQQEQRDWIGSNILRLCLRELAEFKFMQTDPNWTNFLFNPNNRKIELLDFGASREYPDKFVDPYIRILIAAAKGDRDTIRDLSIQLGYLTGHESTVMLNAHVTSVLTLAEPFRETRSPNEAYDFRDQTITDRVRGLIPVMVRERLAPPPEETYSLHRKLSGAFLLLARLSSRVECRRLFEEAVDTWERGGSLERASHAIKM